MTNETRSTRAMRLYHVKFKTSQGERTMDLYATDRDDAVKFIKYNYRYLSPQVTSARLVPEDNPKVT